MKTPNERIADLEEGLASLSKEIETLSGMLPWAIHKSLEGLLDAKKITYIEKRLIWEAVSKEIMEGLVMAPRLTRHLEYRLREVDRWSQHRR